MYVTGTCKSAEARSGRRQCRRYEVNRLGVCVGPHVASRPVIIDFKGQPTHVHDAHIHTYAPGRIHLTRHSHLDIEKLLLLLLKLIKVQCTIDFRFFFASNCSYWMFLTYIFHQNFTLNFTVIFREPFIIGISFETNNYLNITK